MRRSIVSLAFIIMAACASAPPAETGTPSGNYAVVLDKSFLSPIVMRGASQPGELKFDPRTRVIPGEELVRPIRKIFNERFTGLQWPDALPGDTAAFDAVIVLRVSLLPASDAQPVDPTRTSEPGRISEVPTIQYEVRRPHVKVRSGSVRMSIGVSSGGEYNPEAMEQTAERVYEAVLRDLWRDVRPPAARTR